MKIIILHVTPSLLSHKNLSLTRAIIERILINDNIRIFNKKQKKTSDRDISDVSQFLRPRRRVFFLYEDQ